VRANQRGEIAARGEDALSSILQCSVVPRGVSYLGAIVDNPILAGLQHEYMRI
jgi:hypothetical protein